MYYWKYKKSYGKYMKSDKTENNENCMKSEEK